MASIVRQRRDTTANWTTSNPVIPAGQICLDTTLKTIKVGDGTSNYLSLPEYKGTYTVDELTDAVVTTPTTGQVLMYNGTNWVNNAAPSGGTMDHTALNNIGTNTHAQIDTALTRLANTSGTNTGDQDLSGYLLATTIGTTVQGYDVDTAKLDVAQTFTAAQRGSISAITYGATITPNFAVANNFACTLTGNVTIANPTNLVAGQYGKITLIQDATGGRTTAYGTYFKFAGGTAPTLVTTANAKTTLYYEVASTTEIIISSVTDWK